MFNEEEEQILKLMAAEVKARMKLGLEREKQAGLTVPLQETARDAQTALKEACR